MSRVDYDGIAPAYDRRYAIHRYDETQRSLLEFVGPNAACDVCEVGCGTGHWLATLRDRARTVVGIDPSSGMLEAAHQSAKGALIVRGRAETLPFSSARFDRIYAINAFHHFADATAFASEARRVLRPGGAVMTIGLDAHTTIDQWWVWDYFPMSRVMDRERYAPTAEIRALFERAGFENAATSVAEHFVGAHDFGVALEKGIVDRRYTSQFQVISDADYEAGRRRLEAERPALRADLRLYQTIARAPVS